MGPAPQRPDRAAHLVITTSRSRAMAGHKCMSTGGGEGRALHMWAGLIGCVCKAWVASEALYVYLLGKHQHAESGGVH